jgi:hypothetical protein
MGQYRKPCSCANTHTTRSCAADRLIDGWCISSVAEGGNAMGSTPRNGT